MRFPYEKDSDFRGKEADFEALKGEFRAPERVTD